MPRSTCTTPSHRDFHPRSSPTISARPRPSCRCAVRIAASPTSISVPPVPRSAEPSVVRRKPAAAASRARMPGRLTCAARPIRSISAGHCRSPRASSSTWRKERTMNAPLHSSALFRPSHRLSSIGVSEILRISGLAAEMKRQGRDVIILGAGEPDFDTPDSIKDAAERAMRAGATKYTALDGAPELKAAIRAKFKRDSGLEFAQDEITVSAGAKQVLFNAMMATINPGDEVIIPTPFWVTYADIVAIAGGTPVLVPCSEGNGFRLSAEDLEHAIT